MLLTIERHREIENRTGTFLRVVVNGEDVTSRCMSADDSHGWALVYQHNSDGRKFLDFERNQVAREVLVGSVIFDGTRGRSAA